MNEALPLRDQIFTSRAERGFLTWYRKFFSIEEIETSAMLQWCFGAFLVVFLVTFVNWIQSSAITVQAYTQNSYTCWPYFQTCGKFYFLQTLPYGYSQSIFYTVLLGVIVLVAYLMYKKEWVLAHLGLLILWVWKVLVVFVLSMLLSGNYEYYDIVLLFVLLFLPHKSYFLRLVFVVLYFLAATIKIHSGWILATYFTTLQTSLPIFSNALAPLFTNLVICMQVVGCWFLLSKNSFLQRSALTFFLIFHFYSGSLVGYRYLISTIPLLIILFGIFYETREPPLDRRSSGGWIFIVLLFCCEFFPILILPGNQEMTLEGAHYGLYMFDANHQCISRATVFDSTGASTPVDSESYFSRDRCDPYAYYFFLKNVCERDPDIVHIRWTFDQSINGEPFYELVNVPDACALTYDPFSHNPWISLDPPIVGYPVKDFYD